MSWAPCIVLRHSVMSSSLWPHGLHRSGSSTRGLSRQEYWSGMTRPPPGYLPNPGIEPRSPTLQVAFHSLSHEGSPESPVSHSTFPLAIYVTYGNGCVTMLFSQFVPFSSSPTMPTSLFMSASPLLPCTWVHQYHLSRFHMHALIYNICLSDLLYFVKALGSCTSLGLTRICFL